MPRMSKVSIGLSGNNALNFVKKSPEKEKLFELTKKVCFKVRKLNVAYQTACTNGNARGVHVVKATGAFMKELKKFKDDAQVKNLKKAAKKSDAFWDLKELVAIIKRFYSIDSDNCYSFSPDDWKKLSEVIVSTIQTMEYVIEKYGTRY